MSTIKDQMLNYALSVCEDKKGARRIVDYCCPLLEKVQKERPLTASEQQAVDKIKELLQIVEDTPEEYYYALDTLVMALKKNK